MKGALTFKSCTATASESFSIGDSSVFSTLYLTEKTYLLNLDIRGDFAVHFKGECKFRHEIPYHPILTDFSVELISQQGPRAYGVRGELAGPTPSINEQGKTIMSGQWEFVDTTQVR